MITFISQRSFPSDAVANARIAAARALGYTDIFWTLCHEIGWRHDWVGRKPYAGAPGFPNPPVPLPYLSEDRVAAITSLESTAVAA